ncbi:MAG: DUF6471 domain-containing protein [Aliidongia sp.]
MKTEDEWAGEIKRVLRGEMARRGVTYDDLTEKLAAIGITDTAVNIRNKVARGKFSAAFLAQCMAAIGCKTVNLASE